MVRSLFATGLLLLFLWPAQYAQAAETTLQDRVAARRAARVEEIEQTSPSASSRREKAIAARLQRRLDELTRMKLLNELGDRTVLKLQVFKLVNATRKAEGLSVLQLNTDLAKAAQLHAEDMLRKGYFSHYAEGGEDFVDRIKEQGYGVVHAAPCSGCSIRTTFGENIAKGQKTAQEVMDAWIHSPPHKKNILSPDFEEIGIGIAGVYWVQNFGAITVKE